MNPTIPTEPIAIPTGKMAVILERTFDASDLTVDYFNRHRVLDGGLVALVNRQPRTEKLIRRVLQRLDGLPSLQWTLHKEDWSMGHGIWLQSETAGRAPHPNGNGDVDFCYELRFDKYSKSKIPHPLYIGDLDQAPAPAEADPLPAEGVQIRRNEDKNGIELAFAEKPAPPILDWLRESPFRWHRKKKIWYAKFSQDLMQECQALLTPAEGGPS